MRTTAIALGTASMLILAACDPKIDPPVVIPDPVPLSGTYSVVSRFEVPAAAAAPGPLGDALGLIHGMAENPARALLDTAEEAGVPALGTLRLLLPGTLEAKVEETRRSSSPPAAYG
jgi:hypothetical protein